MSFVVTFVRQFILKSLIKHLYRNEFENLSRKKLDQRVLNKSATFEPEKAAKKLVCLGATKHGGRRLLI
jgi:hypothetical protein